MGYLDEYYLKQNPLWRPGQVPMMSPTLHTGGVTPSYKPTLEMMRTPMPQYGKDLAGPPAPAPMQAPAPAAAPSTPVFPPNPAMMAAEAAQSGAPSSVVPPSPEEPKGLLGGLTGFLDDNSSMLNKLGAAYFAMHQDPSMQQYGFSRLKDIRTEGKANKTAKMLREKGRDDLAQAVESGMLSGSDAMKMMLEKGDVKVVGKSMIRFNPQTGKTEVLYSEPGSGDSEATTAFRTLQARAEAAGLKPGTSEYAQFMIDGGTKSGFAMRMGPDGTVEFVQGGASLKPLTEGQGKSGAFYGRMALLQPTIDSLEQQGTQLFDSIVNNIPLAGNYLTSNEYKQYMYAKQNWIAALLRDESGAAIGTQEYADANKQYFPQPGDSVEVIANKRALRQRAMEGMKTKAGPAVSGSNAGVASPQPGTVRIGDVVNGYRFKGGDPSKQENWEKI